MHSSFEALFAHPDYLAEREQLPLLEALIERYTRQGVFEGASIVFGHLLVMNSLPVVEALWRGGASLALAATHHSRSTESVVRLLNEHGIPVFPREDAVKMGEWFFDVAAKLGRARTPRGAAEATRTGVLHYRAVPCPVVSADDTRSKLIEGFFGTGDGMLRAWEQLRPDDPLHGKRCVQFGFGKIGRGVALHCRRAGLGLTVVDTDERAVERASAEGFHAIPASWGEQVRQALAEAELVIAVTGVPGGIGESYPAQWFSVGRPLLINLGAEDEFGTAFEDGQILGGRSLPLNFHLARPTRNRYIDPALAAHLLAMESLIKDQAQYQVGVHPLPQELDAWVVQTWREHWPEEDLAGIGEDLGLT